MLYSQVDLFHTNTAAHYLQASLNVKLPSRTLKRQNCSYFDVAFVCIACRQVFMKFGEQ